MAGFCRSIFLSLLLLCLGVTPGSCQDFLVAKVLTVHVEKMEIEVTPVDRTAALLPEKAVETLRVQVAAKNSLPQKEGRVSFPGCVVAGDTIRLWGAYVREGENRFMVTDIRGCRGGGCFDPTGVRSRLQRGRRDPGHRHEAENFEWESDVDGVGNGRGSGGGRGGANGGNGGGSGGSGGGR